MQQSRPYYILKVLSGPHLGAEVRLAEGEYRLGRDESCDIVLSDRSLAGEHALLAIAADGVRAQSLAGEVRLDHRAHAEPARLLPFFTVVGLGTTHLAVGPEAADWPELLPPALPSAPPALASGGAAGAPPVPAAPLPSVPPAAALPVPRGRSARVRRRAFRVAAVFLVLAVATAVGSTRTGQQEQPAEAVTVASEPPPPTPREQLAKMLASEGWGGLSVTEDTRGRLVVEGHVASQDQRQAFLQQMKGTPVPAQLRVYSGEEMVGSAQQALQALGHALDVAYQGDGTLRLAGYIPEASDLQRVVDIVQRDVAGLKGIKNEVLTDRAILGQFENELKAAGLGESIRLRLDKNHQVSARGTVRSEEMPKWAELQQSFDQRFGRHLQIVSQVNETRRELGLPGVQLNVRAVGLGSPPFVVLGDGEKYLEGSVLTDGWTIIKISRKEIVLSRGGQLYVHEL